MKINTVSAESAPQAAGGYSQGVAVSGAERLLFISGQFPKRPRGMYPTTFRRRRVWFGATYLHSLVPRA
jgi:2-iminobutanoate/2-iminopropanoate deaminase